MSTTTEEAVTATDESSVIEGVWKNADGKKTSEAEMLEWVTKAQADKDFNYELIVGSDSQMRGRQFCFITVVCLRKVGKGGDYRYNEHFVPRTNFVQTTGKGKRVKGNQKLRMFSEVERSIAVANDIFERTGFLPVVHIDASTRDKKEFTSEFSDELAGMVKASGFDCLLKPESWVANAIADRHTK